MTTRQKTLGWATCQRCGWRTIILGFQFASEPPSDDWTPILDPCALCGECDVWGDIEEGEEQRWLRERGIAK